MAGSVLGSSRAIAQAAAEPGLRIVSIARTHDPARIAALPDFVCVNSALEADLLGQVNSETAGGRYAGAIGGSVDFLRASVRAPGGRSVVALPAATSRGRARIVDRVERVTALGSDVDVIATEYGVAEIRGRSSTERAHRIIEIAAPEHREALRQAAAKAADGATTVLLEAAPDEQFFNDITADVLISNGIGADPDGRLLYHVDSGRGMVWRFALDAADIGASREIFVSTGEYDALPDGLAVAADGSVWVALAGAGLVVGWDAGGARIAEIAVPHALVTSVCFGGPRLGTLYILTGTNEEYPNADGGSVFAGGGW